MLAVAERKTTLQGRLQELMGRLNRIETELDEPASKDSEDRATERETTEVLEDLGVAGMIEVRMIEAALSRIENGTYGICAECGDPISEARLDVLPHTPKCAACAGKRA
ncbi:TraR/DksA family transcriptional regulator [Amaricoccus macauensis]|uniref:TraR/DksA family transcriptional regulator n=1 Tax=Amaricoccus macauensis TaxID=57001 RepID=UPI003C7D6F7B